MLILPGVDDPELIRLSVEKVQLPRLSTAVMHLRYMNEDVKVSGGASVDSNSIVCRDFVDRQTLKVLNKWMEQVHDPATGKKYYYGEATAKGWRLGEIPAEYRNAPPQEIFPITIAVKE